MSNSNKAGAGSITGTTGDQVVVTCADGYSGDGTATCQTGGTFTAVTCAANSCTATEVSNSNKAGVGSITGTTGEPVEVACADGYSGDGTATCQTGGTFTAVTCAANSCTATEVSNSNKAGVGSITGTTGEPVEVACDLGYSGGGTATCATDGTFNTLTCAACVAGTYNDVVGSAACKSCTDEVNGYSTVPGLTKSDDCKSCSGFSTEWINSQCCGLTANQLDESDQCAILNGQCKTSCSVG